MTFGFFLVCKDEQTNIELEEFSGAQEFDPQVREHLEELNRYATRINQLEKCFQVNGVCSTTKPLLIFF